MTTGRDAWERLDDHLAASDPDSCSWADGLGCERAARLASALGDPDWATLRRECAARPPTWRRCLVDALDPKRERDREVLSGLALDHDDEVACQAMRSLAHLCGVQSANVGLYPKRRARRFVTAPIPGASDTEVFFEPTNSLDTLRGEAGSQLALQARALAARVDPVFAAEFEVFATELEQPTPSPTR